MFEDYSFNLEFSELSEDLQEEKIDDVITYNYNNGNYETEIEGQPISLETFLTDSIEREKVRDCINDHFPIYF